MCLVESISNRVIYYLKREKRNEIIRNVEVQGNQKFTEIKV